ncbi:MAG: NAD(P)H-hydrate epimerase [Gammaproteobacteria bacterium]|nr:NAD(P)H-hydrate epimerase [Gammaproteobacteria bacterium]
MSATPAPAVSSALYDSAALRAIEARATAALGGDGFELMRRAGRAAWRCSLRHWPSARRILVVCGPGNNGGDGYVFARHALDAGRDVGVLILAGQEPRSAQAQRASAEFRAHGGRIEAFAGQLPQVDLIVDALFGIGFARTPDAAASALIEEINAQATPRLALDVSSGLHADRGSVPGAVVRATRTLEFIAAKAGLRTGAALDLTGTLELAELDVPAAAFAGIVPKAEWLQREQLPHWLAPRRRNSHKGGFGRVLCIGGDHGSGGAIALCAEAALRSGAGLVEVVTRAAHVGALLSRRPEAMAKQASRLPAGAILTPHPGEAARLLATTVAEVQGDRFQAARALCEGHGCVVVLKGAGTVIAAPGRVARVLGAGNAGMAAAGMGDALTGVIAALRAQGLDAYEAASCGALLHAVAGDAAAREDGERGLLPSDLIEQLRRHANPEDGR